MDGSRNLNATPLVLTKHSSALLLLLYDGNKMIREKPWLRPERRGLFAAETAALPAEHKEWITSRHAEASAGYRERRRELLKAEEAAVPRGVRFAPTCESAAAIPAYRRPETSETLLKKPVLRLVEEGAASAEPAAGAEAAPRLLLPLLQGAPRALAVPAALVELARDRFLTFGRSKRCDVVCGRGGSLISKQHAAIDATANAHGCWEIRVSDLASTNGTFVYSRGKLPQGGHFQIVPLRSSQRVHEGFPATIYDGDLIALGQGAARILYELQLPLAR